MDLPNLLSKLKQNPPETKNFLAIEITATVVKSAVWQVLAGQTQIVSIGSIQTWETEADDDLLTAIDASLSEALAGLEKEPNQVVFGLPETWVSESGIADSKKATLKHICQKLALKPEGFVVTTEALIQFLRDQEGGPPSAILINVSAQELAVSLVHLGSLEGTQVVGRSSEISADVEEGLARFPKSGTLPSRMILYDGREDLESLKQDLLAHEWQSKLRFLHIPKIETLPKDESIKAVSLSGGAEVAKSMGFAVAAAQPPEEVGIGTPVDEIPEESQEEFESETQQPDLPAETDQPPDDEAIPDLSDEFGFTTVSADESEAGESAFSASTPADNFVPVSEKLPHPSKEDSDSSEDREESDSADNVVSAPSKLTFLSKLSFRLPKIQLKNPFRRSAASVAPPSPDAKPKINPRRSRVSLSIPPVLVIGLVTLILIVLGGFFWYYQFPTAQVTVYVSQKPLEKQLTFTLDPSVSSVDASGAVVPGAKEVVEVSGQKSLPASGQKTVGERAKGKVTVYNRTTSAKKLPAGTVLKAQEFRFTLDEDVTIASASTKENADFSVTTEPSKAEGSITAADIGPDYNLPKDTQFSVANFASESFIAVAQANLSGGSSRQVQVVSKNDLADLKASLVSDLEAQVTQQLAAKTSGKGVVNTDEQNITDETYSAKVGEEADEVSLSLTMEQTAYTYNIDDLTLIAQQVLSPDIPSGFNIEPKDTSVSVMDTEITDNDTVNITAKTVLKLIPQLNPSEIAQHVKGKYPPSTEAYFKTLPNFVKTEVVIKPQLPSRLNTYPKKAENINVEIVSVSNQ